MATRGLLLALGNAAALGLGRFAYALVLPLMQAAWGLSYAEGGLLGSANTLGYLLGALLTGPLWGPWVERVGGRRGLFHVLLVLFLGSLPPLALRLPPLSALLFGLSFLGVITAITQAFRAALPPSAWPRAMGLSTAAFALGQALGPTVAGLFTERLGKGEGALWAASALLLLALFPALPQKR
jgi:MFS family permease